MDTGELLDLFERQKPFKDLLRESTSVRTVHLTGLSGSSLSLTAAGMARKQGGIHIFIMDDRDSAGYLYNDLDNLPGSPENLYFFPTAYKRSIQFGQQDPSGIIQRTAALNAIKDFTGGYLIICTYPEAVIEKVVDKQKLADSILTLKVGENYSPGFIEEVLRGYEFEKVDFVYEPGQFSIRGGIIDIFSYGSNRPYRVDLFGDEIDSIRHFDINSQLSVDKLDTAEIVPNLKTFEAEQRASFASFAAGASFWLQDGDYTLKRFDEIRKKLLAELEEPKEIDNMISSRKAFLADTGSARFFQLTDNIKERPAEIKVEFRTSPQPPFSKNFDLLAENIESNLKEGYTTYLLTPNKAQVERLRNIFNSIGAKDTRFENIPLTLHLGFIDHSSKSCFYTDHQIFDRFDRYKIRGELDRGESLTIQELNTLKVGDYVVHIDHGVGKFGGLTRTVENGKVHEAIKLVYRDNDVLLVNVHALHRISKYKDKDSEAPRIYKLGSGAWQRMKQNTKKAVKDIARELIALYATRLNSKGFAFSPDTYLQNELEASFIYEDTPDQQTATEAVKHDMEQPVPMDRLICGDVGFGKTEIAIRAAFKAVSDSKQVAVLVPTTILALQHYRTFSERLKDFPVRVEYLNRTKSAKEVKEITADLGAGKIDILIGTHKILGKGVEFKDLGLLIIDEEQKFGVAAKEKLRQMKTEVDTLTLSATPIPRTLQFSLMGSRDLSVITTPPPNRQPIATESHLFNEDIIREAIEFELARGGQVYLVHNRVDNIDKIADLVRRVVPGARIAVGHGQMDPKKLENLIMDFIYGEYDVLVSTTIIESGVDIPNANTIIINNAQNFGLSDLHQLRGRVGRSNRKAYCYLLTPPDELLTSDARRRLRAIEEFSELGSGFNIAMQDLDIRGAGNLLGGEQSGFIADIGFETYRKILNEAMAELREETGVQVGVDPENTAANEIQYVTDTQIDTDTEAYIPDDYVGSTSEKIRLYRELDNISSEEALTKFETDLTDRFGPIGETTAALFDIVRIRWIAMRLGFEKVIAKNGIMILHFTTNPNSSYYKSDIFGAILKVAGESGSKFIFRQNNNKLTILVRNIHGVGEARKTLEELALRT